MDDMKIALAKNQFASDWHNTRWTEAAFRERIHKPLIFTVTTKQYQKLGKKEQGDIKGAAGAYLPGECSGGKRKVNSINCRSALNYDFDHIKADDWAAVTKRLSGYSWIAHTTASHTPEAPRWRLIVFIDRELRPDEWEATARMFARINGFIDLVDPASFRVAQCMFFPGHPSDGEFLCESGNGKPLAVNTVLAQYTNRRDITTWPTAMSEKEIISREIKAAQEPQQKNGIIGAFNRAYGIHDVIDTFLQDKYAVTSDPARYDYIPADSAAGVVVYDNNLLYSHHTSDPAADGHCHNAFDLLRIHRFGDLGEKESLKAMLDFAGKDEKVKTLIAEEKLTEAERDFPKDDPDWKKRLTYMPRSMVLDNSVNNLLLILENDTAFRNIRYNRLACQIFGEGLPWNRPGSEWRDADTAQLVAYIEKHYGVFSLRNFDIALTKVADDRSYHPIREYLDALPPWDNEPRLETVFVTYLGAEDVPYVHAVTRKTFVAAVARIKRPGIKFDTIPVLSGPQGIGKSTLFARVGREWYSDSLSIPDMKDKTAPEKLQGNWILELSELAGIKKMDVETMKSFASRVDDKYRPSYGRVVESHPRQCIIIGTTNSDNGFLRDITGNRRFWPIKVSGYGTKKPWEITDEEVDQLWAEALHYYEAGEKLYLTGDEAVTAAVEQRDAMEQDEREGLIQAYLDRLLPENWDATDIYNRRIYIEQPEALTNPKGMVVRTMVSNMEVWCECFGKRKEDLLPKDSYAIAAIMERLEDWEKSETRETIPHYGRQRVYIRKGRDKELSHK